MNGKINAFLIAAHDDLKSELKKGDQSFFGGAQRTCNIVTRSIMRVDDQAHRVNFFFNSDSNSNHSSLLEVAIT